MIIVKTKNGAKFVNEKEAVMVCHDKKAKQVSFNTRETMRGVTIEDVESVTFITDTQAVEWKDEGLEIERLQAELENEKRENHIMREHFGFIREWFFIYQNAFDNIKKAAVLAKNGSKCEDMTIEALIDRAEKKYAESKKCFEKVREKWDKKEDKEP